jgi:hypothetical protein
VNSAEKFGVFGVQERARRSEQSRLRPQTAYDWDAEDAIPLHNAGRKRTKGKKAEVQKATAEPEIRKGSPEQSYRVRDAAIRAQKKAKEKRAAYETVGTRTSTERKERPRTVPGDRRKERSAPDLTHNRDEIFQENAQGDRRRIASRAHKAFQLKRALMIALVVTAFVVLLTLLVYKMFFVVSEIRVVGDSTYTPEQIIEASGVAEGDGLYSFSSRVAMENTTLRLPYINALQVDRAIPHSVTFTVSEEEAVFWAEVYGETRALSATLRVLDEIDEKEAGERGLIHLRLPAVESAVSGRVIVLQDERNMNRIRSVLTVVMESSLFERITAVDLRSYWELYMISDDCYRLEFGSTEDVAGKLRVADAVLKDPLFDATVKAQIDLTLNGSTSVIFDDQLCLEG